MQIKNSSIKKAFIALSTGKMSLLFNPQVALADLTMGQTELVSINNQGLPGYKQTYIKNGVLSADGAFIAFTSDAFNLLSSTIPAKYDLYLYDIKNDDLKGFKLDHSEHNNADNMVISNIKLSADGRYLAVEVDYLSWRNELLYDDIVLLDSLTGKQTAIYAKGDNLDYAEPNNGKMLLHQYGHQITEDGEEVLFQAIYRNNDSTDHPTNIPTKSNYHGVYAYNRISQQTEYIDILGQHENSDVKLLHAKFSTDGRYITFISDAQNLVSEALSFGSNVYIYDRETQAITLASGSPYGVPVSGKANAYVSNHSPSISADGSLVTFISNANNLVANDHNNLSDIFIYNRLKNKTSRIYVDNIIIDDPNISSERPHSTILSADGRTVLFSHKYQLAHHGDVTDKYRYFLYRLEDQTLTELSALASLNSNEQLKEVLSLSHNAEQMLFYLEKSTDLFDGIVEKGVSLYKHQDLKNLPFNASPDGEKLQTASHASFTRVRDPGLRYSSFFDQVHNSNTISEDGRYILFASDAANLVSDDGNQSMDLFLRDNREQVTKRLSFNPIEPMSAFLDLYYSLPISISRDGKQVVLCSYHSLTGKDEGGVYVYHIDTDEFKWLAPNNYACYEGSKLSADNNYFLYSEYFAGNLLRISSKKVQRSPTSAPIPPDFYLKNLLNNEEIPLNTAKYFSVEDFVLSGNNQYIVYSARDIRLNSESGYQQQIYLYDLENSQNHLISLAVNDRWAIGGESSSPAISDNGRFIAFTSEATNLVPNDNNKVSDIFLHDRLSGITKRITHSSKGVEANDFSRSPSISASGRFIAYFSQASNLVGDDNNEKGDIFIYDRLSEKTILASVDNQGKQGDGHSYAPSISADGTFITYQSFANNLDERDNNWGMDIFRTRLIETENRLD